MTSIAVEIFIRTEILPVCVYQKASTGVAVISIQPGDFANMAKWTTIVRSDINLDRAKAHLGRFPTTVIWSFHSAPMAQMETPVLVMLHYHPNSCSTLWFLGGCNFDSALIMSWRAFRKKLVWILPGFRGLAGNCSLKVTIRHKLVP